MSEQAASWDMMDCTKQHGNNMANAKQVLDVHVSKGITVAQSNEHMRNWTEKGWKRATDLGNYDTTREHLNFEVVSGGKIRPIDKGRSIPERMAELLHKRGIKDPNEGLEEPRFRTVVNIIFGGSRTRMQELAFGKQSDQLEDFGKKLDALTQKYSITLSALGEQIQQTEKELQGMLDELTGSEFDEKGIAEFKKLLGEA